MRVRLVIIMSCFLLAACATGGDKAGVTEDYPESKYLTATGQGDTEPEARERAVGELARIFESKVTAEATDRMKSVLDATGTESFEQEVASKVRVVSSVELKGVEVPVVWKEDGIVKAMAVLHRGRAAREWKARLREMDAEVDGLMGVYRGAGTTLSRYRALMEVSDIWVLREVLASRLNVIGASTQFSPIDAHEVFSEIPRLKADMPVMVDISSLGAALVVEEIAKSLGERGFTMTKKPDEASVVIAGKVFVEPIEIDHPKWKYARATAAITVKDNENGQIVAEVSEDIRGSHLTLREASQKAMKKLIPEVVSAVVEAFERSK